MILQEKDIQCILENALNLLEKQGIKICLPEAVDMLRNAGCTAEGEVVKLPRALVKKCIETTPSDWIVYDKKGQARLFIGRGNTYYGTADVSVWHLDYKTGERRLFTMEDTRNAAKVTNCLENIDFVCPFGTPSDVPEEDATLLSFNELQKITTKPIAFVAHNLNDLKRVYASAAEQVGGMDKLMEKPFLFCLIEPCSPFIIPPESVEKILWCSEHNMPFFFNSAISLGATAPVTIAGALVECLVEELAAMVIAQVNRPGSPLGLGACIGVLDMKYGVFGTGGPEYVLGNAAFVEIAKYLKIPAWTNGGQSQAKTVDEQAAIEYMMACYMPNTVEADVVYDPGYLESGQISSLEMVVLADEIIGYARRVRRGIEVNEDTLAIETIEDVGIGGNFLAEDHTFEHFREELWMPELSDHNTYDGWKKDGGTSMRQRIVNKIDKILSA